MSTENPSGLRADTAAISALGRAYQSGSAAVSDQAARCAAAASALRGDALGPVGSVLTDTLRQTVGRYYEQVTDLSARLDTAHHTAESGAAAFVDADSRSANMLGELR